MIPNTIFFGRTAWIDRKRDDGPPVMPRVRTFYFGWVISIGVRSSPPILHPSLLFLSLPIWCAAPHRPYQDELGKTVGDGKLPVAACCFPVINTVFVRKLVSLAGTLESDSPVVKGRRSIGLSWNTRSSFIPIATSRLFGSTSSKNKIDAGSPERRGLSATLSILSCKIEYRRSPHPFYT